MGQCIKLIGTGLESNLTYQPILTEEQIASLEVSPERSLRRDRCLFVDFLERANPKSRQGKVLLVNASHVL